jgi:hypothetical protein
MELVGYIALVYATIGFLYILGQFVAFYHKSKRESNQAGAVIRVSSSSHMNLRRHRDSIKARIEAEEKRNG